jgi:ferric-dicitrate binding protein FerR (iron transport regulator)
MPARKRESTARWTRRGLIAASLGGASLLGLGWSMLAPAGEYYASAVGEVRRIPLEDGSTLVLNTDSRARVHFGRELREVRLLQGEALFEVAHDARRPFVVQSAAWQVRAVGTVFGVRLRGTEVDVTVSEGVVEFGKSGAAEEAPQRIAASEQTILAPMQPIRVRKLQEAALERRIPACRWPTRWRRSIATTGARSSSTMRRWPCNPSSAPSGRRTVRRSLRRQRRRSGRGVWTRTMRCTCAHPSDRMCSRHGGGNETLIHLLAECQRRELHMGGR